MAFACCKMWWAKMNTVEVANGPPEGKEHRTPEKYFADVIEGSRLAAAECGQDIISNENICVAFALYYENKACFVM